METLLINPYNTTLSDPLLRPLHLDMALDMGLLLAPNLNQLSPLASTLVMAPLLAFRLVLNPLFIPVLFPASIPTLASAILLMWPLHS